MSEIATKWTKIARSGGIEAKFMVVDRSTIMFTMEKGQDTVEVLIISPLKYYIVNECNIN